jgi:predicted ester cyclase/quinol monooxygenase YgiN
MTTIVTTPEVVTYINVFGCEPENADRLVATLKAETQDVVRSIPGFLSATLHRSLDGCRVANYAQWTSIDAFVKLIRSERGQQMVRRVRRYANTIDVQIYRIAATCDGQDSSAQDATTARQLVSVVWDAVEGGYLETLSQLFASDADFVTSTGSGRGIDHIVEVFSRHRAAYADLQHSIVSTIESPDRRSVSLELEFSGTHVGMLRHPDGGEIKPTGQRLRWRSCDQVRTARGVITSWRAYFDRLAVLGQLRNGSQ